MCDVVLDSGNTVLLQNLRNMGAHLKKLKLKMLEAEAVYEQARKEYHYYASTVLPMEMFSAGFSELKLSDGGVIRYEQKYYCQPNKNEEDKRIMAEWLRKHDGEALVKEKAAVSKDQIDKLREAGIPYTEIDDINTNSLKAFLKNNVGVSFTIDEVPDCMHFQEVSVCEIDL